MRARRVRQGRGFVESDDLLAPDTDEQDEARLHYVKFNGCFPGIDTVAGRAGT